MQQQVDIDYIQELVDNEDFEELNKIYKELDLHPADWAYYLEELSPQDLAKYIELTGPEYGSFIFEFVSFGTKKEILELLSATTLARIVNLLNPDDKADLIEEVDEEMQEYILSLLFQSERQNILRLISYPENSAGSYMTTEYALLRMNDTVETALEQIRLQAPKKENVYYIYVVDSTMHLVGFISLRRLIMAPRRSYIKQIMDKNVIATGVDENIENVAQNMRHYDFLAMPVVDENERLVGLITFDDIYDVIHKEATEDMYLLANLDTDETISSPVHRSVKLRLPWLLLNLLTGLLVAYTVTFFEDSIDQFVALAVMVPVVALLGGNAGNQSLAVVVRALAVGEITLQNHWRVLGKEIFVGFLNGLCMGGVISLIGFLWYQNSWLAMILWISMAANLVIAGLVGSMIPLLLRKLKLDPALGSSIFVTTATDVGGFFIFLSLGTIFLQQLLGS